MLNAGEEGPGPWVPREAKDIAAADPGQPAGPGDQQEAQRSGVSTKPGQVHSQLESHSPGLSR